MLAVDGCQYKMTCVSMGNPHAVTYSVDGRPIKVKGEEGRGGERRRKKGRGDIAVARRTS